MKLFILKKISIKSYSKICYKPYNLTQIIIYASQYVFTQENGLQYHQQKVCS